MNNNEAICALAGLARLDMDAYFAYSHALPHLDSPAVRERFRCMRNEHLEHVQVLRTAITDAGGKPPALTRDIRGFLFEGMTLLRSVAGPASVMRTMCSIEKIICRSYAETLALGLPDEFQMLCEQLFANLASHTAYLLGVAGVAARGIHAQPQRAPLQNATLHA